MNTNAVRPLLHIDLSLINFLETEEKKRCKIILKQCAFQIIYR